MLVDLPDGSCRECGGQLEIVDADDATMDVQCTNDECGEAYTVEPDAFQDGCVIYYIPFMVEREFGPEEEDQ